MTYMYLIVGTERALLIDTGTGDDDLTARIREITDLPVTVAATHGHVDHIGGAGQFDELYLHPDDFSMVKSVTVSYRRAFFLLYKFTPAVLKNNIHVWSFKKTETPEIIPMEDGHVFDLGGRKVTVTHTPGHTKGSVMFYDDKSNLIFGGDNTGVGIMVCLENCGTVKAYSESLSYIYNKSIESGAKVYGGHKGSDPLAPEKMKALIDLSSKLAAKEQTFLNKLPLPSVAFDRTEGVSIVYQLNKIS